MNIDAVEKGFYEVIVDDVVVSKHSKPNKAVLRACEEQIANSKAVVYVRQPNIEPVVSGFDEPITEPDPIDDPVTEPPTDEGVFAFTSAYGGGSLATGGRGLDTYIVNTLDWNGSGGDVGLGDALSYCKSNNGGNILFSVSGTISATNPSSPTNPRIIRDLKNVTIAGQSAPEGGIDTTGQKLEFLDCDNLIIRYIAFRPKYDIPGNIDDGVRFRNASNIILDHCEFFWGKDEACTFFAPNFPEQRIDDITIQNCLFAYSKTAMLLGDSNYPEKNNNLSFLNNLTYNITHRFPNISTNGNAEIINNFIYNYKYRLSVTVGSPKLNYIGNYIESKPNMSFSNVNMVINQSERPSYRPLIYVDGNVYGSNGSDAEAWTENPNADNWKLFRNRDISDPYNNEGNYIDEATYRSDLKFDDIYRGMPILSSVDAREFVTENAGKNKSLNADGSVTFFRDSLDQLIYDNIKNNIKESYNSTSSSQDYTSDSYYIGYHSNVSNTPINVRPNDFDTNGDGIPDVWAGINMPSGKTYRDIAPNGYTYLENYLNSVDE